MRKSRFAEARIVASKSSKAGKKAVMLCRERGVSEMTLYNWRAKYTGLEVSTVLVALPH